MKYKLEMLRKAKKKNWIQKRVNLSITFAENESREEIYNLKMIK